MLDRTFIQGAVALGGEWVAMRVLYQRPRVTMHLVLRVPSGCGKGRKGGSRLDVWSPKDLSRDRPSFSDIGITSTSS